MTATHRTSPADSAGPDALTLLGVTALLAGGALHAKLALDGYGTDDLITLFALNGIGSALVGAWILFDRRGFAAIAGLGVSVVSLLAFALSRTGDGVVGFRGVGLDPSPEALATLVAEGLAAVLLGSVAFARRHAMVETLSSLRSSS